MPRSPSKDLADRFNGNRGYFHRPEALRLGKYALSIVALAGAIGWAAVDIGKPPKWDYSYSHGPLARAHRVWDDNCEACHRAHSVAELGPSTFFQAGNRWHDMTCEQCHTVAPHQLDATPADAVFQTQCWKCHHDHGGRDNSLTRISDSHCTRCHANLAANHTTHNSGINPNIKNFVTDHPEFRALIANPPGTPVRSRTLKFSHALHLTTGLTYVQNGKDPMTVERITKLSSQAAAERFGKPGQDPKSPITLECGSCHQFTSGLEGGDSAAIKLTLERIGEATRTLVPPRTEGAYYLPVNFEAHCRVCHPLKAPDAVFGDERRNITPRFDIPHRKQPLALQNDLIAGYVRGLVAEGHSALVAPVEPGGLPQPRRESAAGTIRVEAERLANIAMSRILSDKSGCAQCHDLNGTSVAPVPDHSVWFQHAKFNHAAHRAVTCATCHSNCVPAFAQGENVVEKEPLQISGVSSCKACHAPLGTLVELHKRGRIPGGGVRHSCVDCHRYHTGDHGLQGGGAETRKSVVPHSLSEFLSGK
ncbi:MAG TPA: cytochrome c3 family protein [Gemmata sp.]|nr:cytochrome c3 family protein [Gemmata sp.]